MDFPWVKIKNLASATLARALRRLPADWQAQYGVTPLLVETFVDPTQYTGGCYRAANWIVVGKTTGRGKDSNSDQPNRSLKLILVLPLQRRFRELLIQ